MGCDYYTNEKGEFIFNMTFYDETGNKIKEVYIEVPDLPKGKSKVYFDLLEGEGR